MKKTQEEPNKTASGSGKEIDKNAVSSLVQKFREKIAEIDEVETFRVSLQKEISDMEETLSPKNQEALATLESKRTQLSIVPGFLRKLNAEVEKLTTDIQEALPQIRTYAEATLRTRYNEVLEAQTEGLMKFWPNRETAREKAKETPAVRTAIWKIGSISSMENDDPVSQAERILAFLNDEKETA